MMTVLLASSRNILQTVAQGSLMQAPVNSLFFWKTVAELSIKAHFRLIIWSPCHKYIHNFAMISGHFTNDQRRLRDKTTHSGRRSVGQHKRPEITTKILRDRPRANLCLRSCWQSTDRSRELGSANDGNIVTDFYKLVAKTARAHSQ